MPRKRRQRERAFPKPDSVSWPPLPDWPGLRTPVVAHAFDELSISVAFWLFGDFWYAIHVVPNITGFEFDYGGAPRRWKYNEDLMTRAQREQRVQRGRHAGFCDVFVPVRDAKRGSGVFVAGPFATARPTSGEVLERWLDITGSQGRLSDPAFSQYLSMTLSTLTLEGRLSEAFERLMVCFANLVVGGGDSSSLAREAEALRRKLIDARAPERMWEAARNLVDDRMSLTWPEHAQATLGALGLARVPEHVAVGLLVGRRDESDPIDDTLRRDAFLRASAAFAAKYSALCGRVGDHGVAFLVDYRGSGARARSRLVELSTQAAALAKRFQLRLHTGIGHVAELGSLPECYRAALWSAEKALLQGVPIAHGEKRPERSSKHLRTLRSKLAESIVDSTDLLGARFDRYVESVLAHCGYRLEPVRGHLDTGLERLAEPLLATGALDEKSFDDLCSSVEQSAEDARTVIELVDSYRRHLRMLEAAMQNSVTARHDRGIERARRFIDDHLSESLSRARVARAAGFAPDYFSRLFKREEGVTFERYLRSLRVERAKHMLRGTSLTVEGIRKLCGFTTRNYFHGVFKELVGATPVEYRRGASMPVNNSHREKRTVTASGSRSH